MTLTEEQKKLIWDEYNSFKDKMYAGKTKEERDELGQFFTPADLTIQIIEALDCSYEEFIQSDIIDPTSGSGNLLAAALLIGVPPEQVFGNEYDAKMVKLCRKRLQAINPAVQNYQIHRGNALQKRCVTEFSTAYERFYDPAYIDDMQYAQGHYPWAKKINGIDSPDAFGTENQQAKGRVHDVQADHQMSLFDLI